MKKYKTKGHQAKVCPFCGRKFAWTKPFDVHMAQTGEQNCVKKS